jgi:hypothetical protein
MGAIQIRALLQPRGPAAAVVLDNAQVAAVGEGAKRFPVVATINGYTWRTLVESGAVVAFGTDAPVEPMDMLPNIHAAVTRTRTSVGPIDGTGADSKESPGPACILRKAFICPDLVTDIFRNSCKLLVFDASRLHQVEFLRECWGLEASIAASAICLEGVVE